MKTNIDLVKSFFLQLQNQICQQLETFEDKHRFLEDVWQRSEGGGGKTRVLENGDIFEKAGVNFSHVFGDKLPPSASAHRPALAGAQFEALGVSIVIHPRNPFVPTTHFNIRYFQADNKQTGESAAWFGGGFDLTPYYGFEEDCRHWHSCAKNACDPFGSELYPQFKKQCDEYFYLKHRQEARGIGGLFFDDFYPWDFDKNFAFAQSVSKQFMLAYLPIVQKRKDLSYNKEHKDFQLYRRGRYVEFNLVYDRGTLFGLQSGGRSESILMSLPPEVVWRYDWAPKPGTAEAQLYEKFLIAQDWLS